MIYQNKKVQQITNGQAVDNRLTRMSTKIRLPLITSGFRRTKTLRGKRVITDCI